MIERIALVAWFVLLSLAGYGIAHSAETLPDSAPTVRGDPARAEWFKSLKMPGTVTPDSPEGVSCCDIGDCKRTVATRQDNPEYPWRAIVPGMWVDLGTPDERQPLEWMDIHIGRVVTDPKSYDGEAYVCSVNGYIYCFIPPIELAEGWHAPRVWIA